MKIGIKVGDIMGTEVVAVKPETKVKDCAKLMNKKRAELVVIKKNSKIEGVLTEKDIIWALTKNRNINNLKVKDLMVKNVISIEPDKDIYEALLKMKLKKAKWLPVINKGNIIGMLTLKDILQIEPSLVEIAMQKVRTEEESLRENYPNSPEAFFYGGAVDFKEELELEGI